MATVFQVRSTAGKGRFFLSVLSESPLVIKAEIPAKAIGGRANRALVLGLEKALGCRVQLLSGHSARRKTLAAECDALRVIEACRKMETEQR